MTIVVGVVLGFFWFCWPRFCMFVLA